MKYLNIQMENELYEKLIIKKEKFRINAFI